MKFDLLLSLQEISAIKVATLLWNCIDRRRVKECLEKCHNLTMREISLMRKLWTIEDEVKGKISALEVPESRKKDVMIIVNPLGIEILKWCQFHCFDSYLGIDIPNEFYWTSRGTIDLKKTAEVLVRDENVCLTARYKLACIYCLEENITELWLKMPDSSRSIFYIRGERTWLHVNHQLVSLWTLFKLFEEGMEVSRRKKIYQTAFELAACSGNIVATKFFWEKLTPTEDMALFVLVRDVAHKSKNYQKKRSDFPQEYYPEVLFFLLSQLKAEHQIEIYRIRADALVTCLTQWPFHSLLTETANIILNYSVDVFYHNFLIFIAHRVFEGHRYYNYSGLFTKLWQNSSLTRKKFVASRQTVTHLITMLILIKDARNVKLILEEINPVVKKEYLFSEDGLYCCCQVMKQNGWDFLRMIIIPQCVPLTEDLEKFKEKVTIEMRLHPAHNSLVSLLNSLICQQHKRKREDDCGNPSKKPAIAETE